VQRRVIGAGKLVEPVTGEFQLRDFLHVSEEEPSKFVNFKFEGIFDFGNALAQKVHFWAPYPQLGFCADSPSKVQPEME
jgi:hypothetical protein